MYYISLAAKDWSLVKYGGVEFVHSSSLWESDCGRDLWLKTRDKPLHSQVEWVSNLLQEMYIKLFFFWHWSIWQICRDPSLCQGLPIQFQSISWPSPFKSKTFFQTMVVTCSLSLEILVTFSTLKKNQKLLSMSYRRYEFAMLSIIGYVRRAFTSLLQLMWNMLTMRMGPYMKSRRMAR